MIGSTDFDPQVAWARLIYDLNDLLRKYVPVFEGITIVLYRVSQNMYTDLLWNSINTKLALRNWLSHSQNAIILQLTFTLMPQILSIGALIAEISICRTTRKFPACVLSCQGPDHNWKQKPHPIPEPLLDGKNEINRIINNLAKAWLQGWLLEYQNNTWSHMQVRY